MYNHTWVKQLENSAPNTNFPTVSFFCRGNIIVLLSLPFTSPFKVNVFAKTKETENLS